MQNEHACKEVLALRLDNERLREALKTISMMGLSIAPAMGNDAETRAHFYLDRATFAISTAAWALEPLAATKGEDTDGPNIPTKFHAI